MNLFIRKNVYHLLDRYDVLNESGQLTFTADGFLSRLKGRLIMRDKAGIEILRLRKRCNLLFANYTITAEDFPDEPLAVVRQRFSFRPHFQITLGDDTLELRGNLRASNFDMFRASEPCARILKREMSWGDTYILSLSDIDAAPVYAALTIALDNALFHNR